MQGYSYSVFSLVAIVIHLIINFDLLSGRQETAMRGTCYRGFLLGTLAYYVTDALWGIFAGLRWFSLWYIDTIFFFLSLAAFAFLWGRFVIVYLDLDKWPARILSWFGYALLAFNVTALATNCVNHCFFYFEDGRYMGGPLRDPAFFLLIAFNFLAAFFVFVKALNCRDSVRSRNMMVFVHCITMTLAITLQVVWPLTPFTALGCLIGNCFLHVFVIKDEQTAKHMIDLEQALERARAAEKARSMFFSIVSHDIRTPLNAILGYSELLQDGITSQAEKDEALRSIRASGTTLLQLVDDVLDLAKMDSGEVQFQPSPVRLNDLTEEVFSSFRMAAGKKKIKLVDRTAGIPTLMLDEQRFRQILFNLVGNALKFTERGSVTVAASYSGTDLEVSVSDTGCGIPPDMLTRILDPFVQVQDPSHAADRAGGTGLGLSICRSIAEAMGGHLIAESELGTGSSFRLRFPNVAVAGEKAGRDAAPVVLLPPEKLPKRVLVVDDSRVNRSVLTAFLKKAGVTAVEHAGDGMEALAKLDAAVKEGRPCDFVFSDLWMPNMNGVEFIEKLRADSRFNRLPAFALTADTEFKNDPRTVLFTGVLLKPLTYDKLVRVFAD